MRSRIGPTSKTSPYTLAPATLDESVPTGVCVQSASNGEWCECKDGVWDDGDPSCTVKYAWCHSDTLGEDLPPRACVQSEFDDTWYQCTQSGWEAGVSGGSGPLGECSEEYPL